MSVGPPDCHSWTWWRSVHSGGMSQPGKQQPQSRAINAAVWLGVAQRRARPQLSTPPAALWTNQPIEA